jgi:hypothetical protein
MAKLHKDFCEAKPRLLAKNRLVKPLVDRPHQMGWNAILVGVIIYHESMVYL